MLVKACDSLDNLVKDIKSQIEKEREIVIYRPPQSTEKSTQTPQELIVSLCKNAKELKTTGLKVIWKIPIPDNHVYKVEKEGLKALSDKVKALGFSLKKSEEGRSSFAGRSTHEISFHFEKPKDKKS
mgnify:CR=1 FL=1|jgi:hypothetical protein